MENRVGEVMKRFNYLSNEIENAYHEAALKCGLSDSAMIILYTICNNGEECLLSDVTQLSGISKQTINSSIRRLEEDDVVYLETLGRRKKKICLTDKGKLLVKDTVFKIIRIENEIFDSWTAEEQKLYIELTQRYLSDFKERIKNLV
ncbi:MAG: MarR family transcriptional regulator [Lachnospiraceae bacterium]|nr:MarR family transcriptional regulator [Lachnospiraceae bacterium]